MKIEKTILTVMFSALLTTLVACGGGGGGNGGGSPNPNVPQTPGAVDLTFGSAANLSNPSLGNFSTAVAVNSAGVAVGMADDPSDINKAARWTIVLNDTDAVEQDAQVLDGLDSTYSAAYDINDNGLVAGESADGTAIVPVVWPSGVTTATALSLLTGGINGAAYGLNASDQIVGESDDGTANLTAVFWASSTSAPTALPGLGGPKSAAYFLNDTGEAVGEAEDGAGLRHAVVWDVINGTLTATLPMLNADDTGALALSINTAGQIVGEIELADGSSRGVLWQPDGAGAYAAVDLGPNNASAINDANIIAGNFTNAGQIETAAVWDTVTPTPEASNTVAEGVLFSHAYGLNDNNLVVGVRDNLAFAAAGQ